MRNIPILSPGMTVSDLGAMLSDLKISASVRSIGRQFEVTIRNADGAAISVATDLLDALRLAITDFARDL